MKTRPTLRVRKFTLNVTDIAQAMWVEESAVIEEFQDGRVASRWAEHWAAKIDNVTKSPDRNRPGSDSTGEFGSLEPRLSNKCLSQNGVKFQASRFVGSGRTGTVDDLKISLSEAEYVQVVDITQFPTIRLVTIPTQFLLTEVWEGGLTRGGWSRDQLYTFLDGHFNVVEEEITIPEIERQSFSPDI